MRVLEQHHHQHFDQSSNHVLHYLFIELFILLVLLSYTQALRYMFAKVQSDLFIDASKVWGIFLPVDVTTSTSEFIKTMNQANTFCVAKKIQGHKVVLIALTMEIE